MSVEDLNFATILKHHRQEGNPATVAATRRFERIELGVLDLDATGRRMVRFREKPAYDFWVSIGVNALERETVQLIPRGEAFGFDQLMHKMLEEGLPIGVYPFDGFWLDIGRPDDYQRILDMLPEIRPKLLPDEVAEPPRLELRPQKIEG